MNQQPTSPFVIYTPDDIPMAFPAETTYEQMLDALKGHSELTEGRYRLCREETETVLLAIAQNGIVTDLVREGEEERRFERGDDNGMTEALRASQGHPYVRLTSRENDSRPWQVRRNRPDQTFEVLSDHATEDEAKAAAAQAPSYPAKAETITIEIEYTGEREEVLASLFETLASAAEDGKVAKPGHRQSIALNREDDEGDEAPIGEVLVVTR
jgi:hypothetical protein